jgi:hypothetical protein
MIEINQLRWSASHPHVAQPLGQIAVSHWRRQFFVAFALAALSPAAMALCLDPSDPTTTKYYHLTVEEEVRSSAAVIVGTVLKVLGLVEDLSDPEGYTAFIYTVKVTRHLKGVIPDTIELRAGNDSGGFRMVQGDTDVLFLTKQGQYFNVNPCGNSKLLPQGNTVIVAVENELSRRSSLTIGWSNVSQLWWGKERVE